MLYDVNIPDSVADSSLIKFNKIISVLAATTLSKFDSCID